MAWAHTLWRVRSELVQSVLYGFATTKPLPSWHAPHSSNDNAPSEPLAIWARSEVILAKGFDTWRQGTLGNWSSDTPSDLIGLLKTMARTHVAHLARFWQARRRDLRKNTGIDAEGVTGLAAHDSTASSVVARVEMLELALARLSDRDRQILDWRQDGVIWQEVARRLNVPSCEALRKQHERALARIAQEVYREQ